MKAKNRDVLLNRVIFLLSKETDAKKKQDLRLIGESLVNEYRDLNRSETLRMIDALDPKWGSASTIGG